MTEKPVSETREIVEGRSAATPFAFLSGVGLAVLAFAGLIVLVLVLVIWLM